MKFSPLILAAVAGASYGLALALGLSMWGRSSSMPIGSVGEWFGGAGALAAALVALYLGTKQLREAAEHRESEGAVIAAAMYFEILSLMKFCENIRHAVTDCLDELAVGHFSVAAAKELASIVDRADMPTYNALAQRIHVLPSELARILAISISALIQMRSRTKSLVHIARHQDDDDIRAILQYFDGSAEFAHRNLSRCESLCLEAAAIRLPEDPTPPSGVEGS